MIFLDREGTVRSTKSYAEVRSLTESLLIRVPPKHEQLASCSSYAEVRSPVSRLRRGSSAIPQIGQLPGPGRTISGCIGQVYSVRVAGAAKVAGSNAMPHFGQLPGSCLLTSGSIGQMYSVCCSALVGTLAEAVSDSRYLSGSDRNFAAHPRLQKKYRVPRCSSVAAAFAASTSIPHTGSIAVRISCGALSEDLSEAASDGLRYRSGRPSNLLLHPAEQKRYVFPWYSLRPAAFAGSTVMPHTGSFTPSFGLSQQHISLHLILLLLLTHGPARSYSWLRLQVQSRHRCSAHAPQTVDSFFATA